MKGLKLFVIFLMLAVWAAFSTPLYAQTSPAASGQGPVVQQWSVQTSAVALPGGKQSIVATDSGVIFTPSAHFDLFDRNLVSSDKSLQYYAGGVNYRFPAISSLLDNHASNTNFLRLRFGLSASLGIARVGQKNHWGYTAGVPIDYSLTQSGSFTMGAKVEYARLPGYPGKAIIEVNGAFHF